MKKEKRKKKRRRDGKGIPYIIELAFVHVNTLFTPHPHFIPNMGGASHRLNRLNKEAWLKSM